MSLELGGNAPFIVFDDADVVQSAKAIVTSAFRNAGQTCICANRIFVQARCPWPPVRREESATDVWLATHHDYFRSVGLMNRST